MQKKWTFYVFATLFILTSCGGEKEKGLGKYGMLDESTPEYAAVRFMTSIYQDDNIDAAVSLSTPKMARILSRYHTNRNVQRHLLNLKFDTVEITPEERSRVGRSEFSEKATITLFFSGTLNANKQEDLRRVDLVRENGQWLVARIHPDHFM
ncbi:hypothetical protein [Alteromonas sp. ASW11-130]|uniref:hypothetical protein n=1 Tax=Alteromonas sp. ASW11-130 TaxID=3015775 RepID=UPI00224199F4|nr:hypothetical protein [Alteromonas sp. ASW11-130]MCW8092453.1 hypothetical protein [Alteromonas sp. ASW11-130]